MIKYKIDKTNNLATLHCVRYLPHMMQDDQIGCANVCHQHASNWYVVFLILLQVKQYPSWRVPLPQTTFGQLKHKISDERRIHQSIFMHHPPPGEVKFNLFQPLNYKPVAATQYQKTYLWLPLWISPNLQVLRHR